MPASKKLQLTVAEDKFPDYAAAFEHYGFWNSAHFLQQCVDALIYAHKHGHDLPRELRFKPISPPAAGTESAPPKYRQEK